MKDALLVIVLSIFCLAGVFYASTWWNASNCDQIGKMLDLEHDYKFPSGCWLLKGAEWVRAQDIRVIDIKILTRKM